MGFTVRKGDSWCLPVFRERELIGRVLLSCVRASKVEYFPTSAGNADDNDTNSSEDLHEEWIYALVYVLKKEIQGVH